MSSRRIAVRRSGVHGKGVFAVAPIKAGERVVEYKGERISWKEALRRHPHDPSEPNHTFYFALDEGGVIDGKIDGNSARWINHSCAPNCEAEEVKGRVYIHAARHRAGRGTVLRLRPRDRREADEDAQARVRVPLRRGVVPRHAARDVRRGRQEEKEEGQEGRQVRVPVEGQEKQEVTQAAAHRALPLLFQRMAARVAQPCFPPSSSGVRPARRPPAASPSDP